MELLQSPQTWVAVAFGIFIWLAFKPVARLLSTGLDGKAEEIKAELDAARKLREEAETILATYQRKQKEAMKEAQDIIVKAREEAQNLAVLAEEDLKKSLESRAKLAKEKIAQAEAKAIQDVHNHAADIAISAAQAIIEQHIEKTVSDELVALATSDLERKIH